MRIIGGELSGLRFNPPAKNWPTRPTTDISKEALYNILENLLDFSSIRFLDLFGGTASHCYECISRGCNFATYVDKHGPCVNFVKQTAKQFGIEDKMKIIRMDVFKFLKRNESTYDFIFAGPPYGLQNMEDVPDAILGSSSPSKNAIVVVEHHKNVQWDQHGNLVDKRNYGQTFFSFFKV